MRNHSSTTSTKADSFRRIEVITGIGRRRPADGPRGEGLPGQSEVDADDEEEETVEVEPEPMRTPAFSVLPPLEPERINDRLAPRRADIVATMLASRAPAPWFTAPRAATWTLLPHIGAPNICDPRHTPEHEHGAKPNCPV